MPRLLLVDDDEMTLRSSRRFLSRAGFDVSTALSGEEAIEILESDVRIDAVVLDYEMPGMNGVQVLRAIHDRDPNLPTGLWSASTELKELDDEDLALAWFVKDKMRPIGELVQAVCFAIYGMKSPFDDQGGGRDPNNGNGGSRRKAKPTSGWHTRKDVLTKADEARKRLALKAASA